MPPEQLDAQELMLARLLLLADLLADAIEAARRMAGYRMVAALESLTGQLAWTLERAREVGGAWGE